MPVRLTMRIKYDTKYNQKALRTRHAAWQERYYIDTDDLTVANRIATQSSGPKGGVGLVPLRALLMVDYAYVDAYWLQRMQVTPGIGEQGIDSRTEYGTSYYGRYKIDGDVPQAAAHIELRLGGGQPAVCHHYLRGMPDLWTVTGQLSVSDLVRGPIKDFIAELETNYGTYVDSRVGDPQVGRSINTVDADGLLNFFGGDFGVAPNDLVKVTRTTMASGRRGGGVYRVETVLGGAGAITLREWDHGACTGGSVRKWVRAFAHFAEGMGQVVGSARRKTGTLRDFRGANRRKVT